VTIYADRDKIVQVLTNLISNAIKYSPMGETITFGCEKHLDRFRTFVSDEGISPTDQAKWFDPFYRVNNSKYKEVGGFGIGLYLVAEIPKYQESKIEVESEEDKTQRFISGWLLMIYNNLIYGFKR